MKAASRESFSINTKYDSFPEMIIAFVWNLEHSTEAATFALTHEQRIDVATILGYTESPSWKNDKSYSTTRPSVRLRELLELYRATPERWRTLVAGPPIGQPA